MMLRRNSLSAIVLVFIIVLFFSCDRDYQAEKTLKKFMSSQILLPENMICINHGHLFDTCIITKQAFVVYIDSTQCQACRINNIGDYNFVRRFCEEKAIDFMVILSPSSDEFNEVLELLLDSRYPFPIFIDTDNEVFKNHPAIPKSRNYHSFLLDHRGYPIFVGDPIYSRSEKTFNLLKKVVEKRL